MDVGAENRMGRGDTMDESAECLKGGERTVWCSMPFVVSWGSGMGSGNKSSGHWDQRMGMLQSLKVRLQGARDCGGRLKVFLGGGRRAGGGQLRREKCLGCKAPPPSLLLRSPSPFSL